MGNPIYYVAHDPLGNTEQQVAEFDPALLAEAERAGIIFIAVDADGSRAIVPACDVGNGCDRSASGGTGGRPRAELPRQAGSPAPNHVGR